VNKTPKADEKRYRFRIAYRRLFHSRFVQFSRVFLLVKTFETFIKEDFMRETHGKI